MDAVSTDAFKNPVVLLFLFGIVLQIYRLYRVRVYHEHKYLRNARKVKNVDNFVKTYTQFNVCQIIAFIIVIIIIQFVELEYTKFYLLILALISAPIGIKFHFKLKNC